MNRSSLLNSRRARPWRIVAGAVALGLSVAACGSSDSTTAEPTSAAAAESTGAASLVATTASGGQIDFGALEGNDYVLWFWAPW